MSLHDKKRHFKLISPLLASHEGLSVSLFLHANFMSKLFKSNPTKTSFFYTQDLFSFLLKVTVKKTRGKMFAGSHSC